MIVRKLPDSRRTDINWDAPCSLFGWPNMVTQALARDVEYPEHEGTLSIKCAFDGREIYETSGTEYVVDSRSYLILNSGQRYASRIGPEHDVESFCIFFRPGFAEGALWSLTTPSDRVLDREPGREPVVFIDRLYQHDQLLSPLLFNLRRQVGAGVVTNGWVEEQFHNILHGMLEVHRGVIRDVERIPAARRSTRVELYRRLSRAREFIEDNLHEQINLSRIAGAAYLSVHHFLRLFKQAFGETPHQYLTRRRLEHARELLLTTDMSVTDICRSVGFLSLGSFSWLFRSRVGASPEAFRRALRNGPPPDASMPDISS